jgi:hypothetical protein
LNSLNQGEGIDKYKGVIKDNWIARQKGLVHLREDVSKRKM